MVDLHTNMRQRNVTTYSEVTPMMMLSCSEPLILCNYMMLNSVFTAKKGAS